MKTTSLVQVRRSIKGFSSRSALCDTCGNQPDCRKGRTTACSEYIPTLKFRDLRGTDGRFATFRSPAWSAALKPGEQVTIGNGETSRRARVVAVYSGLREEMEERFGPVSHLSVGKPFDLEAFRKERKRQIGTRLYAAMIKVSVIVLE